MFWNRKKDDDAEKDGKKKLPDWVSLPDGVTEDDVESVFVVEGSADLRKLPHEALCGLTENIMKEHGKLLFMSRELCMEMMLMLIQLYGTALQSGADEAAKFLRRGLDVIGQYLVANQVVDQQTYDASVQIGLDMVSGRVKDKDEAMRKLQEMLGGEVIVQNGGARTKGGPTQNTAPAEEIERIRKVNEAFGAALNPNSNRAKRPDDAF